MSSRRFIVATIAAAVVLTGYIPMAYPGGVEWEILNSLNTETRPLDVAVSADGKSIFVLTENGQIRIYSSDGILTGKIAVDLQAERIAVDPDGERIYVTNRPAKRVDVILVDVIRDINLAGAPFKGKDQAPVVLAVFSDFQ